MCRFYSAVCRHKKQEALYFPCRDRCLKLAVRQFDGYAVGVFFFRVWQGLVGDVLQQFGHEFVWFTLFFVDVSAMANFHDVDDQLVVDDLI